jgi:hypothetical protein
LALILTALSPAPRARLAVFVSFFGILLSLQ